jgi:PadR family transcriptional regulator, regulatory protein PadR
MRRISDETAAVLSLFLDAPERWMFGREIIIATAIPSGSLYPILRRLNDRKILVAEWESLDQAVQARRRPRRHYRLDPAGADRAWDLMRKWRVAQAQKGGLGIKNPAPAWS